MGTQPRSGFKRVESPKPEFDEPVTVPEDGPSIEQCENVAMVMGFHILPEAFRPSYYEESMRNLHALIVRMLNGDEQATRTVEKLRAAFGREDPASQGSPHA